MQTAGRLTTRVGSSLKSGIDAIVGRLAVLLLKGIRRTDPDRIADRAAAFMRRAGPWLPEHRTGRANLAAAYPNKSAAEIEEILGGVWDNLGRVVAEYAHLDRLWDWNAEDQSRGRIEFSDQSLQRFFALRDDGKPALLFSAHLANWELPALVAARYGLEGAVLFRAPSIAGIAAAVNQIRSTTVGTIATGIGAPSAIMGALERGIHVGILIDQFFYQGIDVEFFGRPCKTNPIIARLARHFECPIHGVRVIRLPGHRFRLQMTEAIEPVRDSSGTVDIHATTQMITGIVEDWVREHPEQWLWLHRRWR